MNEAVIDLISDDEPTIALTLVNNIDFELLDGNVCAPKRGRFLGLALFSPSDVVFDDQQTVVIDTRVRLKPAVGASCRLMERQRLAADGLRVESNSVGADGAVSIVFKNYSGVQYKIHKNERIAQAICEKETVCS